MIEHHLSWHNRLLAPLFAGRSPSKLKPAARVARYLVFRARILLQHVPGRPGGALRRIFELLVRCLQLSSGDEVLIARRRQDLIGLAVLRRHIAVLRPPPAPPAADPPLVVMATVSDLRIDPRVERAARTAAAAGFRVRVVFPKMWELDKADVALDWGPRVAFVPLAWDCGTFTVGRAGLFDEEFCAALAREPAAIIHAHDLNTCLIALEAARRNGARVIADFHEWWSENVNWDPKAKVYAQHDALAKRVYRAAECLCFRDADEVVTVCDAIADAMADELGRGRRALVVRNIPRLDAVPTRDYPPLKAQFCLPEDRFLLLWQGGTGPTRLIEPIIEALAHAPECTLLIRGPSLELFGEGYRALAAKVGAADRLILAPPVPSRDVAAAARGADAGIWTLPALCRNFTYALPNKIFEYMAAELPVLAADYPEARRLVEGEGIGTLFDPYDPTSIAAAINGLIYDPANRRTLAEAVPAALARMNADKEWAKLAEVYKRLMQTEQG